MKTAVKDRQELKEDNLRDTISVFKPVKTIDEQISYLENKKNVVFKKINKKQAGEILLRYNYINIITPFKHFFAKKNNRGEVIKDENNNHIYENEVDFFEYYNLYKRERDKYSTIAKNIIEFESQFNAITSYYIFQNYELDNYQDLDNFFKELICRVDTLKYENNTDYSINKKEKIKDSLEKIKKNERNTADKYCLFDRLSFGELLNVYICLDDRLKMEIYKQMQKYECTLKTTNPQQFIHKIFYIVSIRNYVMHGNSLEILIRFSNPKTHELRKTDSRTTLTKLINELAE